jgi:outer membrane protein OmpA-like peptidoglycan-associated protein
MSAGAVHAQTPPAVIPTYLIFFAPNSTSFLRDDTDEVLKAAVESYRTLPSGTRVSLTGYTDTVGSTQANLALSQRRAEAAKAYLVKAGVPAASISATGLGETDLLEQTADETPKDLNNRVEIRFK